MQTDPFYWVPQSNNPSTPNSMPIQEVTTVEQPKPAVTIPTPTNTIQTSKPTTPQRPISRLSIKSVMIWCWVLFMMVVGWLMLVFYNLIKNPTQLANLWMDISTTKALLQTFAAIFFWLLTFLWIGLLITNLYKIIVSKNKSKFWYIIATFFWFLIFITSLAFGAKLLNVIRNISVENILDSDKLVMPYLIMKDGPKYTRSEENIKLIAPSFLTYKLNTNYFNSQIRPTLWWQPELKEAILDCGNWQNLDLVIETAEFDWQCIYFSKWDYPLNLKITYINVPTWERFEKEIPAGSINFDSEIKISTNKWDVTFNDAKTEMIAGKTPTKVTFDASQVFRDLSLPNYKIFWDANDDLSRDKQDSSDFTYIYTWAKLYNINIRFPELNDYIYTFPMRIEQSDVPVCQITAIPQQWLSYDISTSFIWDRVNITDYQFSIIDPSEKNQLVDTIKSSSSNIQYQFQWWWTYAIRLNFITDDGKLWECESENIIVGPADFKINYDVFAMAPQSTTFKKAGISWSNIEIIWDTIIATEIPLTVQFHLLNISPSSSNLTKQLLYDDKQILSTDWKIFTFTIDENKDHTLKIIIQDTVRGVKTEKEIPIQVKRQDIIWRIIVKPDYVWYDPFTVNFDASTTTLNDPSDEIVYFSRDFWDGTIKKNLSQSIIDHTYRYDITKESWEYKPVLTIKTKKGRELSFSPDNNIIVKKPKVSLKISVDSHPTQIVRAGDRVVYSLEIGWLPNKVLRDFWNGKTYECNGRECTQISSVYENPWDYVVKCTVTYDAQPTVEGNITIKVK